MTRTISFFLSPLLWLLVCAEGAVAASADSTHRQHGIRYSALKQIDAGNVAQLEPAWTFNTGDMPAGAGLLSFQDGPLLIEGNLIVCSPSRNLFALDPVTGQERWRYDPGGTRGLVRKCRGVGVWQDPEATADAHCATRLLMGTLDYRLVAVDARDGQACADFGDNGQVSIERSTTELYPGEIWALARPAVVNDTVVVGSSVADNQRIASPSGRVMAFDARTGSFRWSFDPVPRDLADPAVKSWRTDGTAPENGGANVWSGMVVDEALDMVYLPTTSPTVDFSGADRPGDNRYSDSVVALHGATGEIAWHQQLVHHDIWDYDLPTAGLLIDYPDANGQPVPALVQNTKQGMIFIFDRRTGEPLVPIEERPVPQEGAVPGEWLSPTQPFPVDMPLVAKHGITPDDAWGFTPIDRWLCARKIESLQHGPIYTPISEKGTIFMPGSSGGPDWGGGAYDPSSGVMVVPSNFIALIATNIRRDEVATDADMKIDMDSAMLFDNAGAPWKTKMEPLLSPLGAPCTEPPWARLSAVDLVGKRLLWQVALGSVEKMAPIPIPWELGTPGVGSPLLTAGGLVFIGYSLDNTFRAFDVKTGSILWEADLPAPANSQPQTYSVGGEQYVVVPAGGHSMYGTAISDTLLAFKLRRQP